MTTRTTTATIDITPIWEVLVDLGWSYIPSDLSEIDENWCYNRVLEYCAGELEGLAELVPWHEWRDMAYDLRDLWHNAMAEDAEHSRGLW